ncbi:DNA repair protein endonuclease SAE2/CtIP C-terminus-domain-containing protein [Mycena alexandri]|uniref:DNA repair protein endonuclease SAE2/CtIP C-terminus-domain-containing protein n=1 Tax=Mycena alexandri TaxID=1745969 RepID=A0AAD6TGL8_9AGAR|nr:DNA repair protein endonuclease SAE2/CtIP C-terminus-domain-containing protein [Mycena alexandri]
MQNSTPKSGAGPKIRDESQKDRDIARLQRRWELANHAVDDLNGQLSAAEKVASKLASSLGFATVYAAQTCIDMADEPMTYKEVVQRAEGLRKDLLQERTENEKLRAQVQELQVERDTLRVKISESAVLSPIKATHRSSSQLDGALQRQLHALQRRYDELQAVKLRAEERYKADYRQFRSVKVSMRSEEIQQMEDQYMADRPNLTNDERKRRRREINTVIVRKVLELEASENTKEYVGDNSGLPTAIISESDKENHKTPVPETRKCQMSSSPGVMSIHSSPMGLIASMKLQPLLEIKVPPLPNMTLSSSRTLVANPLHSHSPNMGVVNQEESPASLASGGGRVLIPNSSDTEEPPHPSSDPFASLEITPIAPITRPALPLSSDTEDDSQGPLPGPSLRVPPLPVRKPLFKEFSTSTLRPNSVKVADQRPKSKPRHSDASITSPAPRIDATDEPPLKKRRVSSPGPARRISIGEPGASAATPLYIGDGDTPRRKRDRDPSASIGRRLKDGAKDKGKGKQKEWQVKTETSTPSVTNARASSSKQLADYSGYKGRGRYANDGTDGSTTINAKFKIDAAQNGGRNFQYDEVVRGREDRRRMEAGDCESCRDYYEAIGPMPNRLQAPLWRTPPGSPSGSKPKPCPHNHTGLARNQSAADITSHKQAISRHRHHWERAKTPPSYWSIGFPDTQEVAKINEKAREMHQQKQKNVQREANKDGGRYKKR